MFINLLQSGESFAETIIIMVAYFLALLFAFSLHEFAHAYTSYKFGDNTAKLEGRLTLNPFKHIDPLGLICLFFVGFGWAKPVKINSLKFRNYKLAMSVVSLAGILTNFIVSFLCGGAYFFMVSFVNSTNLFLIALKYFLEFSTLINIALAIFNLLPIYPLDGFNFIKTFLPYGNKFVNFMFKYGSLILFIVIISPIFDTIYTFLTETILMGFLTFWGLFV